MFVNLLAKNFTISASQYNSEYFAFLFFVPTCTYPGPTVLVKYTLLTSSSYLFSATMLKLI